MTDTYKFIRYVVPGLVLLIETTFLLAIARRGWDWLDTLITLVRDRSFGEAVGLAVIAGCVGYILSSIHHTFFIPVFGPSYFELAQKIRDWEKSRGVVILRNARTTWWQRRDRRLAWDEVTTYWHSWKSTTKMLEGATQRAETMADAMHGAGASLVASILALVITTIVALTARDSVLLASTYCLGRYLAAAAVGLALILFHGLSFTTAAVHTRGIVSDVLKRAIMEGKIGNDPHEPSKEGEGVKARNS